MKGFTAENLAVPGTAPLSFELADGEAIGIAGASGIGKTRLLRAMADLEPHDGRIALDGKAQATYPPAEWRRRVVYLPSESAWWHAKVGGHFNEWPPPDLTALGLDEDMGGQFIERLSSGERQRLAVLRAMSLAPRVLLLDEPTANLDGESARAVEDLVSRQQREGGLIVVWVTHGEAQRDRVAAASLTVKAA